ncbi:hypothetical protein AKJ57_04920 [candidate division MSBL1 archaeon SCGC-AAA259A05]|uniref:Uncharacterized protein n=1 Tax=candidate division MSBL1 archaeon SCGC-AAA259A05 TaxID=1698259 RepID=A0A133U6C6_9EURY|nr:hypothetical protein AKJ57_04920 [candidate division MSBL1 archaeon SCGC-AAA259A05]
MPEVRPVYKSRKEITRPCDSREELSEFLPGVKLCDEGKAGSDRDATGAYGKVTIQSNTREYIESRGIELIAEKTQEAVETFRDIQKEETAVAALHLTC